MRQLRGKQQLRVVAHLLLGRVEICLRYQGVALDYLLVFELYPMYQE